MGCAQLVKAASSALEVTAGETPLSQRSLLLAVGVRGGNLRCQTAIDCELKRQPRRATQLSAEARTEVLAGKPLVSACNAAGVQLALSRAR